MSCWRSDSSLYVSECASCGGLGRRETRFGEGEGVDFGWTREFC